MNVSAVAQDPKKIGLTCFKAYDCRLLIEMRRLVNDDFKKLTADFWTFKKQMLQRGYKSE